MHNPASESYRFDQFLENKHFGDLERERQIDEAYTGQREPLLSRIGRFFQVLNHVRRIRIEVKVDYIEVRPEAS